MLPTDRVPPAHSLTWPRVLAPSTFWGHSRPQDPGHHAPGLSRPAACSCRDRPFPRVVCGAQRGSTCSLRACTVQDAACAPLPDPGGLTQPSGVPSHRPWGRSRATASTGSMTSYPKVKPIYTRSSTHVNGTDTRGPAGHSPRIPPGPGLLPPSPVTVAQDFLEFPNHVTLPGPQGQEDASTARSASHGFQHQHLPQTPWLKVPGGPGFQRPDCSQNKVRD